MPSNHEIDRKKATPLKIVSFRNVNQWVSNDVINHCENALAGMDAHYTVSGINPALFFLKKILTTRINFFPGLRGNIFHGLQKIIRLKRNDSIFLTCMSVYLLDLLWFYKTRGLKIAFIIDAWENTIPYLVKNIEAADIFLVAYQDSIDLLKMQLDKQQQKKIFLFPNFIKPPVYKKKKKKKKYDLIQVGRKNPTLHQWAQAYAKSRKLTYIYQKWNERGMYYLDNHPWERANYQLSYSSLMQLIAQTKIVLLASPDKCNRQRTGNVSPLTHRLLEAAMCHTPMVGFPPDGREYAGVFPKDFIQVPQDYKHFEAICDRLAWDQTLRKRLTTQNAQYVKDKHSTQARYRHLGQIIADYQRNSS